MEQVERMERQSIFQPAEQPAWLASRLLHRQVVDVSAVEPVGRVVDLIFDPKAFRVMALVVQSTTPARGALAMIGRALNRRYRVAAIGLDHVISMDGDVVMVNANPFHLPASHDFDKLARLNTICEMAILTMRGTSLGTLADLLLEDRGVTVTGYVVSPSPTGEMELPALDVLAPAAAPELDADGVALGATPEGESLGRLRFIPASSNVHIGESLILVIGETGLAPERVVVVTSQPIARS